MGVGRRSPFQCFLILVSFPEYSPIRTREIFTFYFIVTVTLEVFIKQQQKIMF